MSAEQQPVRWRQFFLAVGLALLVLGCVCLLGWPFVKLMGWLRGLGNHWLTRLAPHVVLPFFGAGAAMEAVRRWTPGVNRKVVLIGFCLVQVAAAAVYLRVIDAGGDPWLAPLLALSLICAAFGGYLGLQKAP